MQIQELAPFGVEVTDVDQATVGDRDFERLYAAFVGQGLVVVRARLMSLPSLCWHVVSVGSRSIGFQSTSGLSGNRPGRRAPEQSGSIGGKWQPTIPVTNSLRRVQSWWQGRCRRRVVIHGFKACSLR